MPKTFDIIRYFIKIYRSFWVLGTLYRSCTGFSIVFDIFQYFIELYRIIDIVQEFLIELSMFNKIRYYNGISIIESKSFRYDIGYKYCIKFSRDINKFLAIPIKLQ